MLLARSDAARRPGGDDQGGARAPDAALAALPGVEVFPTQTNFVLARVPDAPGWFDGCGRRESS